MNFVAVPIVFAGTAGQLFNKSTRCIDKAIDKNFNSDQKNYFTSECFDSLCPVDL